MYIVRFDDITPGMNWDNFFKVKKTLEKYNIVSVLGVVPSNQDPNLNIEDPISLEDFFYRIRAYKKYGDTIAQHGTHHLYDTQDSGLLKINNDSEFAGNPYIKQLSRLASGKEILESHGVWEPFFMAPAHSFDLNTLRALKELGFKAVTDGYGFYPYQVEGINLVPQLVGKPIPKINFGIQTICLHTNSMSEDEINRFNEFIHNNNKCFLDFKLIINVKPSSAFLNYISFYTSKFLLKTIRWVR